MRVTLMDYTGKGSSDQNYAANLMIWTKRTRVELSPGGFDVIAALSAEEREKELRYMAATVPSSWEFCDFTFLISNVTRAFTHQLVRTRTASYAQQAMQVKNMSEGAGWDYLAGPTIEWNEDREGVYRRAMNSIASAYKWLVDNGTKIEDARGILPTNILTNIVMKLNLRTLCDMTRKRKSPRNQGEFVEVLFAMREEVIRAMPWTTIFLDRTADIVAAELYALLEGVEDKLLRTNMTKLVDQLLTNVGGGEVE